MSLFKIFTIGIIPIIIFTLIMGCESESTVEFTPELVVNGQLKAGYNIDSISVSLTEDITEIYDDSQVGGAVVSINGVRLSEYTSKKGIYYMPDPSFRVESGQTYQLEIEANDMKLKSSTTVPSSFSFFSVDVQDGDTVQYIPGNSWVSEAFFTLQWPEYGDTDILIFRVMSLAEEATSENFIVDDRTLTDILKGEDRGEQNPIIWWTSSDFKYARINWMYFNYTGWHTITVSAMDENYYNYRNGILFNEQRPGEEFNQVVEGGYGLFASSASDTIRVFIVE